MSTVNTDNKIDAFVTRLNAAGIPVVPEDNASALDALEARLPGRMSRSFESLLRRYSLPSFDVCGITLFAWNSDWQSTEYFDASSRAKESLSYVLLPAGLMQIGRPDTGDFDAMCLDLSSGNEQRIVQVDHEEILCNWRLKVVGQLWPSFMSIVDRVLSDVDCGLYYEQPDE